MKKFNFPLDTVLNYKDQVLENLKTEHAQILAGIAQQEERIEALMEKSRLAAVKYREDALEADFVGSTSGMTKWVEERQPEQVVMVTECSMADNVAMEAPDTEFVRPCNLCPHMKRITLENIRDSLRHMRHEVVVADDVIVGARRAVERMLAAS